MSDRKLILVDGTAVLYRAFYAIKDLSTGDGRPTNAIFGFIRTLKQLQQLWEPTHWMVAFDGGLPEERLELMETYKAQRPAMPDSLKQQGETVEAYLDLARVVWTRKQGEEADDVLASVTEWARESAGEVLIATTDKDMFQLVDAKVRIIPFSKKDAMLDEEGVREKTGVVPSQIVEWLALVGDSSDNIPGVPGVGPKTAADLLTRYGSLEKLWEELDDVSSAKLHDSLKENIELVSRNVRMVRLKKDLDCKCDWDDLAVKAPEPARLLPLMEELEFGSMARELQQQTLL